MGNMSCCRFSNTLGDLRDCLDALDEIGGDLMKLSKEEAKAAERLIKMCLAIGEGYSKPPEDEE